MALFVLSTACCPTQWALAQPVVTEPGASKIAPTAAATTANEADKVPAVVPPTVPAPSSNRQPAWGPVRWEAQPTAPIAGISNAECKANDACSSLDGLCCPSKY